jgi:hypothetical protein
LLRSEVTFGAFMSPDSLARALENFLAQATSACVTEDGAVLFDLSTARYSITADRGRCLLHLWSSERNTVRRVLEAEINKDALVLSVQRFGQSVPTELEIIRDRDQRTPSAKRIERAAYTRQLERLLKHSFPEWSLKKLTHSLDLEHSFGPIYTRGLLHRGRSGFAVLGVNGQETQASIDAALTFGILWLDLCRHRNPRLVVEGLKLMLPSGHSEVVRARMANLDHAAAKFQLFEVAEDGHEIEEVDCRDRGNIATRLVRCLDETASREAFGDAIRAVFKSLQPANARATELKPLSATEMSFRLHGLEFARARLVGASRDIVFGAGANETVLTAETAELFCQLTARLFQSRTNSNRSRADALWRMQPERWLESLVIKDVSKLDMRLDNSTVYSQVPAFAASDRAMIDVLTRTHEGRLAVLELKADEDIHLPLQGLDYWARVEWHRSRGEFQRFGYFLGAELSAQPALLFLIAPALHVHPATDTLMRYLSPDIDSTLVGIDERWRQAVKVVFRKGDSTGALFASAKVNSR